MQRREADWKWKCQKWAAICDACHAYRAESLTDWEWLPGELLSESECSKAQLVFRYKNQICAIKMQLFLLCKKKMLKYCYQWLIKSIPICTYCQVTMSKPHRTYCTPNTYCTIYNVLRPIPIHVQITQAYSNTCTDHTQAYSNTTQAYNSSRYCTQAYSLTLHSSSSWQILSRRKSLGGFHRWDGVAVTSHLPATMPQNIPHIIMSMSWGTR